MHSFRGKFRSHFQKRGIDDTEERLTLQHTSFHTQGLVLRIPRMILKKALVLQWAMSYHREQMMQDVLPDTDLQDDSLFEMLNKRVRNNGIPSRHHRHVITTTVVPFGLASGRLPALFASCAGAQQRGCSI